MKSIFAKGGKQPTKTHNPEKQATSGMTMMRQKSGEEVNWEERVQAFKTVFSEGQSFPSAKRFYLNGLGGSSVF